MANNKIHSKVSLGRDVADTKKLFWSVICCSKIQVVGNGWRWLKFKIEIPNTYTHETK